MENSFKTFLGTGWAFPPAFDVETGTAQMVSNLEDIQQSLNILLSTTLGERVMQPQYGCNLSEYLFDSMDSTTIGFIKDRVQNSILFFEPRIIADKIEVTSDDSVDLIAGRFIISVDYTIIGTNSRFNYVYDYYKNEALLSSGIN